MHRLQCPRSTQEKRRRGRRPFEDLCKDPPGACWRGDQEAPATALLRLHLLDLQQGSLAFDVFVE